jgi:hypothetical protein
MVVVCTSLVRYLGVSLSDTRRFRRLTALPYIVAIVLEVVASIRNPVGASLIFASALAATGGANCGLLFMQYYVPKAFLPGPNNQPIPRSYAWIVVASVLALGFILILGPGIQLRR